MDDSRVIRRLEALCPPELGEARERAKAAARTQLLRRGHHFAEHREAALGRLRRARRGRGFAIIAVAGLALSGSALAAIGVWSPLGGGHHHSVRGTDVAGVAEFTPPTLDVPGGAGAAPHTLGKQRRRPSQGSLSLVGPVPGSANESFLPSGNEGSEGPGNSTPHPRHEETGPGGGHHAVPAESPEREPEEPPTPRPTHISIQCVFQSATSTVACTATVTGEAGPPTGQVRFEDVLQHGLPTQSCLLADDGNGTSSSCSVEYTFPPASLGAAAYSGDSTNQPSSFTGIFEI